jgi:predicted ATPase
VKQFQRLVPALQDINDVPFQAGTLELRFTDAWNEALVYKPEEVSDGTMFVLAFLCLQYQSQPPDILLIEEPERGLHPYLMEQVMGLLRALAHGELGPKAVQVVMATHSAELLEYARPEEVRFVNRRSEDGATTVYAPDVNSENWRDIFDVYENSMSGLWLSGTAGGVPGRS